MSWLVHLTDARPIDVFYGLLVCALVLFLSLVWRERR
jgi:hypothetical protein